MDERSAAAVLYGPAAPPPAEETPPPAPSLAERRQALDAKREALAADAEALRAEERAAAQDPADEETAAEKLFGDTRAADYAPSLADPLDTLERAHPELAEHRDTMLGNAAEVFADAQVPPSEAATLYGHFAQALTHPPTAEQVEAWARESREWLKTRYPEDGGRSRLARVRQFVDARPALKERLEVTGVGNHPAVVRALVERSGQLRLRPRRQQGE